MPPCLIHDQNGVRIVGNIPDDFDVVLVHRMGIAPRRDEDCGLAVLRADRAEDVCRARALLMRRGRSRTSLGPTSGDLVLLADPGFILEPDFDHFSLGGAESLR